LLGRFFIDFSENDRVLNLYLAILEKRNGWCSGRQRAASAAVFIWTSSSLNTPELSADAG
jgi:hypothetical protein